jgi:RNA polymerase sigma-70 factor (ECF subfamily)
MTERRTSLPALDLCRGEDAPDRSGTEVGAETPAERLRRVMNDHYSFVWRTARFMGVPEESAEDAAQQVFCVFARKLEKIAPGAELSFLFATAFRVASDVRRAARTRPPTADVDLEELAAQLPQPDEAVDQQRAREILRRILSAMPLELRAVFVLFEIEGMTVPEIAAVAGVPVGTAASRLRRARAEFEAALSRLRAVQKHRVRGGIP